MQEKFVIVNHVSNMRMYYQDQEFGTFATFKFNLTAFIGNATQFNTYKEASDKIDEVISEGDIYHIKKIFVK